MKRVEPIGSLKLAGFNNLTKCLSFNLYDFCVARDEEEREAYCDYVREKYNAEKVTKVLTGICDIIEAKVLAVSDQDYTPWGASSLVLMSDLKGGGTEGLPISNSKAMHLDKSHICAHTYPDITEGGRVCTFRIDIDIATCGEISPLNALNFMFDNYDSDVVVMDYVVRGFTRDEEGKRVYMDHKMNSIQDFIRPELLSQYHCVDLALQSENIWQTKMLRTQLNERSYFLKDVDLKSPEAKTYLGLVKREMRGVLHMWPD